MVLLRTEKERKRGRRIINSRLAFARGGLVANDDIRLSRAAAALTLHVSSSLRKFLTFSIAPDSIKQREKE